MPQVSKGLRFLSGFGAIFLFGGSLFLLNGTWQTYRAYVQSRIWPSVEAHIVGCSLSGYWHYAGSSHWRQVWGKTSYVQCRFNYQVNGIAYENTTRVGDSIFTSSEQRVYPPPRVTLDTMREWIARHPTDSLTIIHHDPGNPNNISLAGADSGLRLRSPYDELWFGVFATAGGLIMMLTGKLAVKRKQSGPQTLP